MKFQHDFKSVPKKRVLLLQQKRPQRGLQGGNGFRRFQTLEIGKWKIPSCQLSEEAKRGQWPCEWRVAMVSAQPPLNFLVGSKDAISVHQAGKRSRTAVHILAHRHCVGVSACWLSSPLGHPAFVSRWDNVRFVGTDQVLQRNASARPFSLVLWADLGRRFGCSLNRQTVPSINFKKCLLKAQNTNFQNWK